MKGKYFVVVALFFVMLMNGGCATDNGVQNLFSDKMDYGNASHGRYKEVSWDATGIWADFPDGAVGSETQLRPGTKCEELSDKDKTCKKGETVIAYKYKFITRKGNDIYVIESFKRGNILSLADLSKIWRVKLSVYQMFGNVGDGGKLSTLVIGIVKVK